MKQFLSIEKLTPSVVHQSQHHEHMDAPVGKRCTCQIINSSKTGRKNDTYCPLPSVSPVTIQDTTMRERDQPYSIHYAKALADRFSHEVLF